MIDMFWKAVLLTIVSKIFFDSSRRFVFLLIREAEEREICKLDRSTLHLCVRWL